MSTPTTSTTSSSKPKVMLVLEGSYDRAVQVGLVKDCKGTTPIDEKVCSGDVVGTWYRYGEGTFLVELTTCVEALQDTFIQLIAERVRLGGFATYPHGYYYYEDNTPEHTMIRRASSHRIRRSTTTLNNPDNEKTSVEFGSLRARLGK